MLFFNNRTFLTHLIREWFIRFTPGKTIQGRFDGDLVNVDRKNHTEKSNGFVRDHECGACFGPSSGQTGSKHYRLWSLSVSEIQIQNHRTNDSNVTDPIPVIKHACFATLQIALTSDCQNCNSLRPAGLGLLCLKNWVLVIFLFTGSVFWWAEGQKISKMHDWFKPSPPSSLPKINQIRH